MEYTPEEKLKPVEAIGKPLYIKDRTLMSPNLKKSLLTIP